ncbi:MAG TPA: NUDIX hydrolase [Thermoplasmata archaeon]|nr:NUDIX hydrolase [Thermoplasmata archaeon]
MSSDPGSHGITVGVGGFLVREEALLVVRKTYGPWRGLWAIPSGYVEPHESVVETIERELVEETGIRGRAESLVAVRHMVGPEANDTFLVFTMEYVSGEPRPDRVEVSDVAFVSLRELVTADDAAPFTKAILVAARTGGGLRLDAYRPPDGRLDARSYLLYSAPGKVH